MNKIPTLFVRNPANMARVLETVTPGCEWVIAGDGVCTIKKDGTNVRVTVLDGKLLALEKRRNPSRAEKAAGAEPGYVLAEPADPSDKYLWACCNATDFTAWPTGAHPCEALGPKIQGGVEGGEYRLYPFMLEPDTQLGVIPTFAGIRAALEHIPCEGFVWQHADGRMAKIKRRDFGLPWPPTSTERT